VKSLVYDTETTGIPKHPNAQKSVQPRVIEFGGVLCDESGQVLEELQILINPGIPLEPIITKITGLTDEDLRMIELDVERCAIADWPWPPEFICTVQEHYEEFGYRPKLKDLYHHYVGEPLAQTHRALDDVHALVQVCLKSGALQ